MKYFLRLYIILVFFLVSNIQTKAQIEAIEGLASGVGSLLSDVGPGLVEAGCVATDCCWDGGFFFFSFLIEHHEEIMDLRDLNPTLLSLEVDASFNYAMHYGNDTIYKYIDYLPRIRGNLGVFAVDYRHNILSEYEQDTVKSFNSWELLGLINMVPSENVKFTFGSGVYYEEFTKKYYNDNYFGVNIGVFQNRDIIDIDTRVVVDYSTSRYPFFEAGIKYNTKIIDLDHIYGYITLGGVYQNYYTAHDIWAAKGGLTFNLH